MNFKKVSAAGVMTAMLVMASVAGVFAATSMREVRVTPVAQSGTAALDEYVSIEIINPQASYTSSNAQSEAGEAQIYTVTGEASPQINLNLDELMQAQGEGVESFTVTVTDGAGNPVYHDVITVENPELIPAPNGVEVTRAKITIPQAGQTEE